MPGFKGLAVPGPSNMPFRIRQAMDVALEDHRAPDFPQFTLPLFGDLKKIFQTKSGQVFLFPGSGTGGWESAIANTLSPGDKVLASVFGQFSLLWVDLCQRFGLEVDAIDVEWGKGVPLEEYLQRLAADKEHKIKAVLVTHNETGDRCHVRCRRRAQDSRRAQSSGHAVCRRRELDRLDRLPHGRVGRGRGGGRLAEGLHVADGSRHRLRQSKGIEGRRKRRSCRAAFSIIAT